MPPNIQLNEQMSSELSPEESKASMGLSTRLLEEILAQEGQINGQMPVEVPPEGSEMAPEQPDMAGVEERLMNEIQSLKELITDRDKQDEIEEIRRELQALIEDDYGQEGESTTTTESTELAE